MSVHKEITKHSSNQHQRVKQFMELDQQRELYIEKAVSACKNNEDFSVESINQITSKINEMARMGIVPQRKLVTKQMVMDYVEKVTNK